MENFHTHDILIIEDSVASAKFLDHLLRKLGYQKFTEARMAPLLFLRLLIS